MIKRFLLVIITLFATTLYAQNDTIKLNDVSITSQRFKLEATTAKTIQMDSIKSYFSQETPYFFSKTPSIVVQSDNGTPFGYSYFTLRGMGQNRINYTLNGVPLNDGEDLAVYTSNYTDLLNSLRSIQITRGAGVSANGASSYVGLVNMDLISPFDKKSNEFSSMTGSFNSHKNSFKFNSGLSKNGLGATFRLSETYTDGFRDFSSGKSFSFSGSVGYHTDITSIRFNTVFGRTQNGQAWLPVPEGMPVSTNVLVDYGGRPQYDNFTSGIYQLQVVGKFSEVTLFNFSTYFSHVDGNYDFPGLTSIQNLKLNSKNWGIYFNVKHSNDGLTIQPGVTVNSFDRQHTGSTEGIIDYKNTGAKFDATIFTKLSYKLGLDWTIEGDYQIRNTTLNYLNDNLKFNGKLFEYNLHNYSLGISYQRSDVFKPYISFGKSSREPSRTNLFGMNDNPTISEQIVTIKPETVRDLEIGTKIKSKYVVGTFNIYSMSFDNEIIPIGQLNSMGIALGINAQKSKRLGIEGDLKSNLKKLEIGTSLNISKNKIWLNDVKSEPVATPSFISNFYSSYNFGKVELGANYKYVVKYYLDNENKFVCPDYHLVDINIIYTLKDLTFKLFVNNILNKNWTTGGITDGTTRSFYYTAGTNYYLTLNYKF